MGVAAVVLILVHRLRRRKGSNETRRASAMHSLQIVLRRFEVGLVAGGRLNFRARCVGPALLLKQEPQEAVGIRRRPAPRPPDPAQDISSRSPRLWEVPCRFPIMPGQLHKKGAGHPERSFPRWQGFAQDRPTAAGGQKPAPGSSTPQFAGESSCKAYWAYFTASSYLAWGD